MLPGDRLAVQEGDVISIHYSVAGDGTHNVLDYEINTIAATPGVDHATDLSSVVAVGIWDPDLPAGFLQDINIAQWRKALPIIGHVLPGKTKTSHWSRDIPR